MLRFEYRKGKGIVVIKGNKEKPEDFYYMPVKDGIIRLVKLVVLLLIVVALLRYLSRFL